MLWPERFSLSIFMICNFILIGFSIILSQLESEHSLEFNDIKVCIIVSIKVALGFWITFRFIDFLGGGPLRRKIKASYSDKDLMH
jgi:hypothetical protein